MAFISNQQTNPNDPQANQAPSAQPSVTSPNLAQTSSPAANTPQQKGSGRFTNIQKYIGANQGAGQKLAGGIEARVQSNVNPNVQKAETQSSQIADQVAKAQGTLGQGQALQQQVADKNFDAVGFAAQQPNVEQFTQFRTGQAIDEATLGQQAQQAQQQAMQAQQVAQGFGQQLGTEQGRQQLLKQTFSPTRNYSVGQQRLDNLFLQQANPQLRDLSQNLNLTSQKLGNIGSDAEQKRQLIQQLAGQESELAQGLTSAIGAREQDVVGAAEARQEEVNKARVAEQEMARQQFQNLAEGKAVDKNFLSNVGLQSGQSLYNVLKEQGNIDDYIKFNPALLQGANQLASQNQRQQYDAVARLAGLGQDQRRIGLEDTTKKAVDFTNTLGQRATEADKKFQDYIKATQVYGAPTLAQAQQIASRAPFTGMSREEYNKRYGGNLEAQGYDSYNMIANAMARSFATQGALQERAQANLGDIVGSINDLGSGQLRADNQALIDRINQTAMGAKQEQTGNFVTDEARNIARSQIQQDVLKRLAEQGYFNRVQADEPTLPTGNIFNVT